MDINNQQNKINTYAYNVFAWFIFIDISIILLVLSTLTKLNFDKSRLCSFIYFECLPAYVIPKFFLLSIIYSFEKKYLKPIQNRFILNNPFYSLFTKISIILQLIIIFLAILLLLYLYLKIFLSIMKVAS